MKFKIEKRAVRIKKNINGKVLEKTVMYYVYRSILFGLIKLHIKINKEAFKSGDEISIEYRPVIYATEFTKEEAEEFIRVWKEEPDRIIKYEYNI